MTNQTSPMVLPVGATLQDGKYRIDGVLNKGGFGRTYTAKHHHLDQAVIIKTLNRSHCLPFNLQQRIQRFITEARRLAQYQHPQIVRVKDLFLESGLPFVVMDYVPGLTLAQLTVHHPLPEAVAVDYVRQIADALATIHRTGHLHRIISPDNVRVWDQTQTVVLTDFGIARQLMPEVTPINPSVLAPGYAAIEQYLPQRTWTAATDIYALAATLYTLLTGHVPAPAVQREHAPLPAPRQFQPQLSSTVEHAVMCGMALKPQERPQTVTEWLNLLPQAIMSAHHSHALVDAGTVAAVPRGINRPGENSQLTRRGQSMQRSRSPQNQSLASPQVLSSSTTKPITTGSVHAGQFQFPKRALLWSAIVAGFTGLSFGLILRYHFTQQFANSQIPEQLESTQKNELFLPKRTPSLTTPERSDPSPTVSQPEPSPLESESEDIEFALESPTPVQSPGTEPLPAYERTNPGPVPADNPQFSEAQPLPQTVPANPRSETRSNPGTAVAPDQALSTTQPPASNSDLPQQTAEPDPYTEPPPSSDFQ